MLIFLTACSLFEWDVSPDYNYLISCKNETKDTLLISIYNGGFTSIDDISGNIIYPDSTTIISNSGVMKGENPVIEAFSEWKGLDSCWMYKFNDDLIKATNHDFNRMYYPDRENLVIVWDAPFRYLGDSINHFFNYDSWDSWLINGTNDGIVQFTIYESDFNK